MENCDTVVIKKSSGFVAMLQCTISIKMVKERAHTIRTTAVLFLSVNAQIVATFLLWVTCTYDFFARSN